MRWFTDISVWDEKPDVVQVFNSKNECIDYVPERTCKNLLPPDWGTFECSECGKQFEVTPVYITVGGTPNDNPDLGCINHCPGCGAKVVK